MNYIICTSEEITCIQKVKNEPFCLVRPIKQPSEGYKFNGIDNEMVLFTKTGIEWSQAPTVGIKLPFAKGQRLRVKETWAHTPTGYVYKADGVDKWPCGAIIKWNPPTMMPKSRYILKVVGEPVVKRVQKLTMKEIVQLRKPLYVPYEQGDLWFELSLWQEVSLEE